MTYIVVTGRKTKASGAFPSYDAAFREAMSRFGGDTALWLSLNLRIEESR